MARLRERNRDYMFKVLGRMSVDELANLAQGFASLARATQAHEEKVKI
jgi:hypothetical protein